LAQAVNQHKAALGETCLAKYGLLAKAHDEMHDAVHATQAGPNFMLWQAKVENLHVVVH